MKKIMFNDRFGLTQAVLDGRKTMTRREITNKVAIEHCEKGNFELIWKYASYKPNEVVAIAQSYGDSLLNMPHHIRITYVGVERLQNISLNDCLREGIMPFGKLGNDVFSDNPKTAFSALIDKVSGKGTWERNPWVYVYEFKLVD